MKRIIFLASLFLFAHTFALAQTRKDGDKPDLNRGRTLYTVGYVHLDTQWNWDYTKTIDVFLKRTLERNFDLFEKYPDYIFTFTGARRYRMMKEYYPDLYAKMLGYVRQGRWIAGGSCVEESEVNVSSSESMIREVLYGNAYYEREFGYRSIDYMLPDCFGFVASMPSVLAHAGIEGFSTQKLTWRSAAGIPVQRRLLAGPRRQRRRGGAQRDEIRRTHPRAARPRLGVDRAHRRQHRPTRPSLRLPLLRRRRPGRLAASRRREKRSRIDRQPRQ